MKLFRDFILAILTVYAAVMSIFTFFYIEENKELRLENAYCDSINNINKLNIDTIKNSFKYKWICKYGEETKLIKNERDTNSTKK